MNATNHGGTAFPTPDFTYGGQHIPGSEGMALRDYMAAKAMEALIVVYKDDHAIVGDYAKRAYQIADAMLEARTK